MLIESLLKIEKLADYELLDLYVKIMSTDDPAVGAV